VGLRVSINPTRRGIEELDNPDIFDLPSQGATAKAGATKKNPQSNLRVFCI
jgi:hypothetical protein